MVSDAAVLLFVGLTKVDVETSGGVLVPAPDLMIVGLGTDPLEVLTSVFGFPAFRAGQREVIDAVLEGKDCIAGGVWGRAGRKEDAVNERVGHCVVL